MADIARTFRPPRGTARNDPPSAIGETRARISLIAEAPRPGEANDRL
ncbi:hypothetical protein [Streptomyces sp. DW26H14]